MNFITFALNLYAVADMSFDYTKQSEAFWQQHLSGDTLKVCRMKGTEIAFTGKYDNFYKPGTYTCACCGGDYALYESITKFDSHTGWPSFYAPINGHVIERSDPNDFKLFARTEVACSRCHSHLGHVFDDGPPPTGKRYCMNSAALQFVPEGKSPTRNFSVT